MQNSDKAHTVSKHWTAVVFIKLLFVCMGLLVVAHVLTQSFSLISNHDVVFGLIPLFDLDSEANIPSFFSTLLLTMASLLLFVNASIYSRYDKWFVKFWIFLGLVFLFLAVDELASLHEQLTIPVRESLGTEGVLYFAWIIPYGVLSLLIGLIMLRFMFRIERSIAVGFVLAGVLYIMGAVGMEMLGGMEAEESGYGTYRFVLMATIEEILEMSGVIVFIHYLLKDIFSRISRLSIELSSTID